MVHHVMPTLSVVMATGSFSRIIPVSTADGQSLFQDVLMIKSLYKYALILCSQRRFVFSKARSESLRVAEYSP